jgi:hypothetical protein
MVAVILLNTWSFYEKAVDIAKYFDITELAWGVR